MSRLPYTPSELYTAMENPRLLLLFTPAGTDLRIPVDGLSADPELGFLLVWFDDYSVVGFNDNDRRLRVSSRDSFAIVNRELDAHQLAELLMRDSELKGWI